MGYNYIMAINYYLIFFIIILFDPNDLSNNIITIIIFSVIIIFIRYARIAQATFCYDSVHGIMSE